MKNIFKLMSIALIAGGLFAACGDKEGNEGTEGGEGGNTSTTAKFTVKFNGSSWDVASNIFMHTSNGANTLDENWMIIYAYKNANDAATMLGGQPASEPYVSGTLTVTPGTYDYQSSGGDYVTYTDPNATVYYEGDDNNQAGDYYRWQAVTSSFSETITACDITARTMSATFTCNHYDLENLINSGMQDYGPLTSLEGTMSNYGWTWAEDAQ